MNTSQALIANLAKEFRPPDVVLMSQPIGPNPAVPKAPRLLGELRARVRVLHYAIRTEDTYAD